MDTPWQNETPAQRRKYFKRELKYFVEKYKLAAENPEVYKTFRDFERAKTEIVDAYLESEGIPPYLKNWDEAHGVTSQIKPQWIYIISDPSRSLFKIGFSSNPRQRRKSFGGGTKLIAMGPGGAAREKQVHEKFAEHRVGGEWFRFDEALLDKAVKEITGGATWVMEETSI